MGYILFLISVLIATLYYFRMAKKFENFDTKIADDLHREMNALILDFNQTASQNITILEDRIVEGKTVLKDIVEQVKYLKQIKDTLDTEIRELQNTIFVLKDKAISIENQTTPPKTLVQKTYEQNSQFAITITTPKVTKKNKRTTEARKNTDEDILDLFQVPIVKKAQKQLQSRNKKSIPKAKALKPNIPKKTTKKLPTIMIGNNNSISGTKAEILRYFHKGWGVEKISHHLNVPKGEVDLIIQLFHGNSLEVNDSINK